GLRYAPDHPFAVTMLLATYSGCQLIAAPLWGRLSDRIGRRPIVLISLTTSVLAYLWLSEASALWMLFAARALQGISAGNISVAQAYIADVTKPENRAKGMGLVGAAIGVGFTLGPAIGGWLAGSDPVHLAVAAPALAAAGMSALALLIALVRLPESLPPDRRAAKRTSGRIALVLDAFSRPRLRPLLTLFFTTTFAFAGMESTFGQWAYARFDWGPSQVGAVLGTVGVLLIVIQGGLIGRLTARFGEARLLFAGTLMIAVGLAAMAASTVAAAGIAACCLLAMGQGLASPATSALVSRAAGGSEQGGILGVNQSMGSAARLLGPAVAGAAFELRGPGAPYVIGAAVMLISAVLAWRVMNDKRREAAVDRPPPNPPPQAGEGSFLPLPLAGEGRGGGASAPRPR
ncbi:MAG TPA: MFS transporter, partial [Stellaceae bacterium]|nr:MFS transporter [Stellaceae bacterium]